MNLDPHRIEKVALIAMLLAELGIDSEDIEIFSSTSPSSSALVIAFRSPDGGVNIEVQVGETWEKDDKPVSVYGTHP